MRAQPRILKRQQQLIIYGRCVTFLFVRVKFPEKHVLIAASRQHKSWIYFIDVVANTDASYLVS